MYVYCIVGKSTSLILFIFLHIPFKSFSIVVGDATQALVTNCIASSVYTASVDIKIVPLARTLVMITRTENDRKELSFIYNEVRCASIDVQLRGE